MNTKSKITSGCVLSIFLAGLISGCAVTCLKSCTESMERHDRKTYEVWCRINPTVQVSFEEWRSLRNNYLLPGQHQPPFDPSNYMIPPNP